MRDDMWYPKRAFSFLLSIVLVMGLCPNFAIASDSSHSDTQLQAVSLSATDDPDVPDDSDDPDAIDYSVITPEMVDKFDQRLRDTASGIVNWDYMTPNVTIDVSDFGIKFDNRGIFKKLYELFVYRHGELFYLVGEHYINSEGDNVKEIALQFEPEFSEADKVAFDNKVNEIIAGVDENWLPEQKALYLHDWIVTHCVYSDDEIKPGVLRATAYDALIRGKAVCQGYATAYDYLLEKVDIKGDIVDSRLLGHSWNMVKIDDDEYYFVDCTWDDESSLNTESFCSHNYFLRSKQEFGHNEKTIDEDAKLTVPVSDWRDTSWQDVYKDSSTTYDKGQFWDNIDFAIPRVGNLWAYSTVDDTKKVTIKVHDYSTSPPSDYAIAYGLDGDWPDPDTPGNILANCTCIVSDGDSFLVTTPTELWRITTEGKAKKVYELSEEEKQQGLIFGLQLDPLTREYRYEICKDGISGVIGGGGSTLSPMPANLESEEGWEDLSTPPKPPAPPAPPEPSVIKLTELNTEIFGVYDEEYTGKAFKPSPEVYCNDTLLKKGVDYTLSYKNNVNAGLAKVIVTGKGKYTGQLTETFRIFKADSPMKVSAKTATVKYKAKRAQTVKAKNAYKFKKKAAGKVTYKRVAKGSSKWLSKVNTKNGNITVKKGAPKRKTFKVKVKITDPRDKNHYKKSVTVTVKVKIK